MKQRRKAFETVNARLLLPPISPVLIIRRFFSGDCAVFGTADDNPRVVRGLAIVDVLRMLRQEFGLMTFTTLTFGVFLVIVFALYWGFRNRAWQNLLLFVVSYIFYGWWDYRFCALMFITSVVDYLIALGVGRSQRVVIRRTLLWTSIVSNLGMLGFFKYYNFFAENLQVVLEQFGWTVQPLTLKIILPVGISFYTFQTLSYIFDVYFGKMKPCDRFIDYMAYVAFFPQLVAGPIERATHFLPQFMRDRQFDHDKAVDGCRQILWGFFKKIAVADTLAAFADPVFSNVSGSSGPELFFATIAFAFQIYCDFSAYSDIATGTAKLFGFELMRNFAYPYFSQSCTEFWRRWHISLSTWFRDYVYVPLGGSRAGKPRLIGNVLLTFAISGLWHGASWNFLIWGLIMGLGIVADVLFSSSDKQTVRDVPGGTELLPSRASLGRMAVTFAVVCLGWIFFRSTTFLDAVSTIQKIATGCFTDLEGWKAALHRFGGKDGRNVLPMFAILLTAEWLQRRHPHPLTFGSAPQWQRWALYTVMIWGTLYIGPSDNSPFIYFQF